LDKILDFELCSQTVTVLSEMYFFRFGENREYQISNREWPVKREFDSGEEFRDVSEDSCFWVCVSEVAVLLVFWFFKPAWWWSQGGTKALASIATYVHHDTSRDTVAFGACAQGWGFFGSFREGSFGKGFAQAFHFRRKVIIPP